jgi:hypothetical protein
MEGILLDTMFELPRRLFEHPSSGLASLGHLLPQGAKVELSITAFANRQRCR